MYLGYLCIEITLHGRKNALQMLVKIAYVLNVENMWPFLNDKEKHFIAFKKNILLNNV